jgi:hypothetical protein
LLLLALLSQAKELQHKLWADLWRRGKGCDCWGDACGLLHG